LDVEIDSGCEDSEVPEIEDLFSASSSGVHYLKGEKNIKFDAHFQEVPPYLFK